jgi:hypothetical protein
MSLRRPPRNADPLRTADDLTPVWRELMIAPTFRDRSLWLLFIDYEKRPTGPLMTIEDLPDGPYDLPLTDLVGICRDILDGPGGGGSVAMLMTRSGAGQWHIGDRAWARFLVNASHDIGGIVWPVYRAHSEVLEVVELPAPVRQRKGA